MDNGPSKEPEQITDSLGKKYTLLPKFPLPEGFEGPTGFLGKGAFGAVSVAYDSQFQPFAIKEINRYGLFLGSSPSRFLPLSHIVTPRCHIGAIYLTSLRLRALGGEVDELADIGWLLLFRAGCG